jgi:alkanesulfonate monooxygenase SsuD/methylene tetrahydromethanopterin reductase-like flavin-dependent oxidoreductase (luciferase family)
MEIGVCVASHVGDTGYVVRAEELGFASAWLADSQMLWSDCYAALALAADRTSRIRVGTGVAVTGTRPAPVTAASIATIHALAPGRTFLGVGAGNTAMRVMGRKPQRIAEYDRHLAALRPLLRGEEGDVDGVPIRHLMPDTGFVRFDPAIPLYVSGFGPRSLGLAGKHGDGAVMPFPPAPQVVEAFWRAIEAGASAAGRSLDRGLFRTTALTTITVLDPGEPADSPRARAESGPFAMATLHYSYDQWRQLGKEPPAIVAPVWDEYTALLAAVPEERLHQRIHSGHNCWVIPEEERFVTRELIEATCLVGTADVVAERLCALGEAGLDEVILLPGWEPRYDVLERVARDVLPAIASG